MSLILDALRRADSERERGAVPGLYAQPVPAVAVEAAPRPRARPWHWIVIGGAAGLVAALAWYLAARETPREASRPAAAASAAPPAATGHPATTQASTAVAAAAPRANPTELQPVAEPAPWPQPESRKPPEKPPPATPAPELAAAKAPAPAAPAEPPIYTREQLPDNVRAELPPLAIGGSIYSASAANRSLIINGRIYRENDALTADLLLEQIKLKAAVLRYKGYRFEVQF